MRFDVQKTLQKPVGLFASSSGLQNMAIDHSVVKRLEKKYGPQTMRLVYDCLAV